MVIKWYSVHSRNKAIQFDFPLVLDTRFNPKRQQKPTNQKERKKPGLGSTIGLSGSRFLTDPNQPRVPLGGSSPHGFWQRKLKKPLPVSSICNLFLFTLTYNRKTRLNQYL